MYRQIDKHIEREMLGCLVGLRDKWLNGRMDGRLLGGWMDR